MEWNGYGSELKKKKHLSLDLVSFFFDRRQVIQTDTNNLILYTIHRM